MGLLIVHATHKPVREVVDMHARLRVGGGVAVGSQACITRTWCF